MKTFTLTQEEIKEIFKLGRFGKYNPPPLSEKMTEIGFKIGEVENGHGGYSYLIVPEEWNGKED